MLSQHMSEGGNVRLGLVTVWPHAGPLIEWKSSVRSGLIGQRSERPVNNDSPCELARGRPGRGWGRKGKKAAKMCVKVSERERVCSHRQSGRCQEVSVDARFSPTHTYAHQHLVLQQTCNMTLLYYTASQYAQTVLCYIHTHFIC